MTGCTQRIGIFGGTFDPVHVGHLITAQAVLEELGLDKVLFVPNREPPVLHKRAIPAAHRTAMLELAVDSNPRFEVDRTEVDRSGPSYTLDTLRQIRGRLGTENELMFILGIDALSSLNTWYEAETLIAEFSLVVMSRPSVGADRLSGGSQNLHAGRSLDSVLRDLPGLEEKLTRVRRVPRIEISSEMIRNRLKSGQSIRYFVPPEVEQYINDQNIYRNA